MRFKVGDIITGTSKRNRPFYITTDEMTEGKVTRIHGNCFWIKVLKHETLKEYIGDTFDIYISNDKYFKKVRRGIII